MGWWMVFGGILWLLFWGSIIYLFIAAVIRPGHEHPHQGEARSDAMEIARRRLAGGEITPDQFEEIRRHLEGRAGPTPQP